MTHWFAPIYGPTVDRLVEKGLLEGGEPWMWGPNIYGDNCGLRFQSREELRAAGYCGRAIA